MDEAQEFQKHQAAEARATAAALDIDVDIRFAESNPILQIQQVSRAVADKNPPDVVLVETVSGEGMERVARASVRAGVGWVVINRDVSYLGELRRDRPDLPIGSVSTHQLEIGRIQRLQIAALLPRGGTVLYVQGRSDTSAARQRLEGARQDLDRMGIEVNVAEGDWTEASGLQTVERWLRLRRTERPMDLVACQNDAMAMGAGAALARAGAPIRQLPIIGVDGLPEGGQRLVHSGQLAATIVVPSNTGPALRAIVEALEATARKSIQCMLTPKSFPELEDIRPSSTDAARRASV
jgi:ribose transport system substrate-binding protein